MRQPKQGDIVLYRPDRKHPNWHDRGHLPTLPAIVVKVWSSGAVNLRVADGHPVEDDTVDLRVFLDHNCVDGKCSVWIFGAVQGDGMDQWRFPE